MDGTKLGTVLIAAGGTGGHLFPAEALAHALIARGYRIELVTDHRAINYGGNFPSSRTHIVSSATLTQISPRSVVRFLWRLLKGYWQCRRIIRGARPSVVVGFGGYPTLPPLLAAVSLRVPTMVHEANAVMGRANRLLAPLMTRVATAFQKTKFLNDSPKIVVTGNPVRLPVLVAGEVAYPLRQVEEPFRLVVFGGSQGARVFADLVPAAVMALPENARARLQIVQQARPEDVTRVVSVYKRLSLTHDIQPFFGDLPAQMALAHLVIGRSGAGTCAELAVIGRPSLLVPLPHALDNDQKANASELQRVGAAVMIEQGELDGSKLSRLLNEYIANPAQLAAMAQAAKNQGRSHSAELLADAVIAMMKHKD